MGKPLDTCSAILEKTIENRSIAAIVKRGGYEVKGYVVNDGYMGYVDGEYRLFADETDYREYVDD